MTYAPTMAMDYMPVRSIDQDGRLRVSEANISMAAVNPYAGDEIPGWQELGLDPSRIYRLWRDPAELALAAPTFENIPLLARHIPVDANDHRPADVVGTIGSDVRFEAPYLKASLIVWAGDSINRVTSGVCKQLSCGYRYTPVMQKGVTPEGEAFDGRMTRLIGNHVAVVVEGRCGPSCVIGDGAVMTAAARSFHQMFPDAKRLSNHVR